MKIYKFFIPLIAALSLTGCYSLADDITPPPGYDFSTPVPSEVPTEIMYFPFMPPNPDAGAAIYAEKCQPCHGSSGYGDGPKAAELPNPVAPIADPELARTRTPEDWYRQVTNGNIDKYMPPFTSLTERQRWDVVAYAFNLSVDPADIPAGRELYIENCAACHGPEGNGDGPDAANLPVEVPAFTDQSLMAERSLDDLVRGMRHPDVTELQDVGSSLADSDRFAIATYLRSLTFETSEVIASEPSIPGATEVTPEPTLPPVPVDAADAGDAGDAAIAGTGDIAGQVVNVSGGLLPDEMEVTLYGFDQFQQVLTETIPIETDGFFLFDQVPMPEGRAFLVAVDYEEATYSSDIAVAEAEIQDFFLPVSIYERSTDVSQLSIDRLHVFFEFLSADTVRVAELILITNPTNNVIVSPEEGQPTIEIDLPPGAQNLQFDNGGSTGTQFVELDGGLGDMRAIQPGVGTHEILFSFDLPYSRNFTLDQSLDFPISALVVMLPDVGVKLNSDTLVSSGTREMEEQGTSFELFTGGGLAAGAPLPIQLSGSPRFGGQPAITLGDNSTLTVGMLALGFVFVVVGVWLYRRQQTEDEGDSDYEDEEPTPDHVLAMSSEDLMDAIIALDERYKVGDLPESAYLKQRSLLKQRLKEILD